ncbi:MAG TPA: type IX secretion system membrane protein PorP/SprF [Bacteroidales bacterium]|nr:type IX secretion system membrane protein PorP/SprF [Bacteroidales bacterium]
MKLSLRIIILILPFLFSLARSTAQINPVSDQYVLNPILINPAHTGQRGSLDISAFYRRQWAGIKGAPETITLIADAPLNDSKASLGFSVITDKTGVTRETSYSTYYSYKVKLLQSELSFGLKAGLFSTNTKWSDLIVTDPGDEAYLLDSKAFILPDFSFGVYMTDKKYFAGFSIPRLIGYDFNIEKNRYSLEIKPDQYYYLFNGGYLIDLDEDISFLPSALISFSPGEKALLDLNAHFSFSDRMWAGLSYRSNQSMAFLVQLAISNQVKAAYSYYIDFNRLGRFSNGSHEIMLRYEFRFRADVVNPLIF